MKGLILAAGVGSRLSKYTSNCPKGMLEFNNNSLLEYQIRSMKNEGFDEIIIVAVWLLAGAHIATCTPNFIEGMIVHPYSKETVQMFLDDGANFDS